MLVGVAGGMCSGKDTVGEYLRSKYGFVLANSSDELRLRMSEEAVRVSRVTQRQFANECRSRHGSGYFIQCAYDRATAKSSENGIAIISFYTVGEAKYFLTRLNGRLIGVVGPELKARYERLVSRSDGSRDELTYEQFLERDATENSGLSDDDTNVSKVLSLCETVIMNTGTLGELHNSIDAYLGSLH